MRKCSLSWGNKWPFSFLWFVKYEIYTPTSISFPRCPFLNRKRPILFCWTRKAMYYLIKANLYSVTLSVKQESLGCGVVRVGRITDSSTIYSAVAFGPGCQSFRTASQKSARDVSVCFLLWWCQHKTEKQIHYLFFQTNHLPLNCSKFQFPLTAFSLS